MCSWPSYVIEEYRSVENISISKKIVGKAERVAQGKRACQARCTVGQQLFCSSGQASKTSLDKHVLGKAAWCTCGARLQPAFIYD